MKHIKTNSALRVAALIALLMIFSIGMTPSLSFASGGSGSGGSGGGGTVQATAFAGNWSGTITTPFGTGAFTMGISQSATTVTGSVHFGAPIFDATRKLVGTMLTASQFSGTVSNGQGSLPITGTLSADGTTITGTVIQGQVYTYTVTRK
jgi:hypothetical protein